MIFTYSQRKMAKLFANSEDPDQMLRSAAYDLGLQSVCQIPFYGSPDYNGLACCSVKNIAGRVAIRVDPDQKICML